MPSKYEDMWISDILEKIADKEDFLRWMVKNHWKCTWARVSIQYSCTVMDGDAYDDFKSCAIEYLETFK